MYELTYTPAESAIWKISYVAPGHDLHTSSTPPLSDRTVPLGYVNENEVFLE